MPLFHCPLLPSSRGSLVPLCVLPLQCYQLRIWGNWYFSHQSWFQLVIHPSPAFCMMYSAYKLSKQGDKIQPCPTLFLILNQSIASCPILTFASWPANRFIRRQVSWSGTPISLRIFQFVVIHTVKSFSIVSEAGVDVFLEFPCFLHNPVNAGNLISCSSAFSKLSMYIWKFLVHVLLKPSLKDFWA